MKFITYPENVIFIKMGETQTITAQKLSSLYLQKCVLTVFQ